MRSMIVRELCWDRTPEEHRDVGARAGNRTMVDVLTRDVARYRSEAKPAPRPPK